MDYRREIDGLRAMAVLPVIFFHAGFSVFSGGYVGVDIFFVISGFLITTIILKEKSDGRFSIVRFYERRAKRILPALFLVMLVSMLFAWQWMLPIQHKDFGQSLLAVMVFASNVLFWTESGYFAPEAESKPLLHTWSLAVEEQYYVFFPLIILMLWRVGRPNLSYVIAGLTLISLGISEYWSRVYPDASFYLAHTRAWELLVGSLCAFWLDNGKARPNNFLSTVGFTLIILAILAFNDELPWPSFYTLIPVLGAAMVILFTDHRALTYRILANPFFVGIGLVSYSAYLWHQPLFAFARVREIGEPEHSLMLILALLALALAYLSWQFVEKPFRYRFSKPVLVVSASLSFIAIVSYGLYVQFNNGVNHRFPDHVVSILEAKNDVNPLQQTCLLNNGLLATNVRDFCWMKDDGDKQILVYGDSHGSNIAFGLANTLEPSGINVQQLTYNGCPPLQQIFRSDRAGNHKCAEFNKAVLSWLSDPLSPKVVVLTSRWPLYLEQVRFDNLEGGIEAGNKPQFGYRGPGFDDKSHKQNFGRAIELSIRALLDLEKIVVIVHPVPEAGWNVPEMLAKQVLYSEQNASLNTSLKTYLNRSNVSSELLKVAQHPNLLHFYPHHFLCDEVTGRCNNVVKGKILYNDDDHLSLTGVSMIAEPLAQLITDTQETQVTRVSL